MGNGALASGPKLPRPSSTLPEPQEFDRASNFRSLGDFCRDTGTGLVAPDLTTVKRSAVAGDDVHDRLHPAMVSSDGEAVQSNDR